MAMSIPSADRNNAVLKLENGVTFDNDKFVSHETTCGQTDGSDLDQTCVHELDPGVT